jgi:uncharacterized protein YraI
VRKTLIPASILVAFTAMTEIAHADSCVVNDPTGTPLNVRNAPSTSAPILGALKNGAVVSTGAPRGDWVRIIPREGKVGWVYRKFLDCEPSKRAVDKENAESLVVAEVDGNAILRPPLIFRPRSINPGDLTDGWR